MTLHQALDIFQDNIDEIIIAISSNMVDDMNTLKEKHVFTRSLVALPLEIEIMQDVHKLEVHNLIDDRARTLKSITRYRDAKNSPPSPSRITDAQIQRAKDHPIEQLYTSKLRKSSGKWAWCGMCELHTDKTASFYIDKKNQYHCFGCHAHGDAIAYYQAIHGATFIQAVRALQ